MGAYEKDKVGIYWTDYRGIKHTREINQVIDVRDYIGTPGYSLLVVAANTDLSISDLERYLRFEAGQLKDPRVERGTAWLSKRRWLFQQPDTDNGSGPRPNADGRAAQALKIMAENPKLSLRDLTARLKEHGIRRSREWVRRNRGVVPPG